MAPIKVNNPLSTCGKNASCWLLLKRCTSSTNTIVRRPPCACQMLACSTASRISLIPPSTAEIVMKCASKLCAISRAMVVLPTPGGPHKMQLCGWPDSNAMRSDMPLPSRCCWPITSPRVWGRSRSASGMADEAAVVPPGVPRMLERVVKRGDTVGLLANHIRPSGRLELKIGSAQHRVDLDLVKGHH